MCTCMIEKDCKYLDLHAHKTWSKTNVNSVPLHWQLNLHIPPTFAIAKYSHSVCTCISPYDCI